MYFVRGAFTEDQREVLRAALHNACADLSIGFGSSTILAAHRLFHVLHHKERYATQAELARIELVGAAIKTPGRRREPAV